MESGDSENILVVNTTITNELRTQEIKLTRTYRFEDNGPLAEQGAVVKVIEDGNTEFLFEEVFPGIYRSVNPFAAVSNKDYQLSIETSDGKMYVSGTESLPSTTSSIERVYPVRMFGDNGKEGVGILVDSFDPSGNSVYYRYRFEETYKIVAPFWVPVDLTTSLEFVDRPPGQDICFNSRSSDDIILTNTNTLSEDRVTGFLLHFIEGEDIRVADRYSVLVRQFVQSRAAHGFYETLANFSESESLFSQVQPGFISGNISSIDNDEARVLGFFNVASVIEERIFFNRVDVINGLPRFSPGCERIAPVIGEGESIEEFEVRLQELIRTGSVRFLEEQRGDTEDEGSLVFVPRPCGDCTVFGSSAVPEFWID
ncbi:hypothetical protein GCM10022258_14610 [Aquimarina gracilis]